MLLTLLGTGSVVPHPDRTCAGYHLRTGPHSILLDCGPGTVHRLAALDIDWATLTHIAITHFHTDHIGDLPGLFFVFRNALRDERHEPLTVFGPVGTRELFRRLARAFGKWIREPGFPLEIRELESGESLELDAETRLSVHDTPHTDPSIAYRIDTPRGSFGYTGDTGYPDDPAPEERAAEELPTTGPELAHFLRGVDILLTECSLPDDLGTPTHLTPTTAAALARAAEPGTLVLTHIYPSLDRDTLPTLIREAGWEGRLIVGHDGVRVLPARGTGETG